MSDSEMLDANLEPPEPDIRQPYQQIPNRTHGLRWKIKPVSNESRRSTNSTFSLDLKGTPISLSDARIKKALEDKLLWHEVVGEAPGKREIQLLAPIPYHVEMDSKCPKDPRHVWNTILKKLKSNEGFCQEVSDKTGIPTEHLRSETVYALQNHLQTAVDALLKKGTLAESVNLIHVLVYLTQTLRLALEFWNRFADKPMGPGDVEKSLESIFPELRWSQRKQNLHPNSYAYLYKDDIPVPEQPRLDHAGYAHPDIVVTEAQISGEQGEAQKEEKSMRIYARRKYVDSTAVHVAMARHLVERLGFISDKEGPELDRKLLGHQYTSKVRVAGTRPTDHVDSSDSSSGLWGSRSPSSNSEGNEPPRGLPNIRGLVDEEYLGPEGKEGVAGLWEARRRILEDEFFGLLGSDDDSLSSALKSGPSEPKKSSRHEDDSDLGEEEDQAAARWAKSHPHAEYVPEISDYVPPPERLHMNLDPLYDDDDKPARLEPPFVLVSVEHMLGSDMKWEGLLRAHPEYADNISRLGVLMPWELGTAEYEGEGLRRYKRDQVELDTSGCAAWLQSPQLRAKLASHFIFLPRSLRLHGSAAMARHTIDYIHRKMLLKARDYICEMQIQDANLLNDEDDIDPSDLPNVNFSFDVFKNQTIPLPRITLRRVLNFLKDNDVDRTIGWSTAIGELRQYLEHLAPMSRGMQWADRMREAANLMTVHEVFEDYFYGKWDFPLGVNMVEQRVRLKAPKGCGPLVLANQKTTEGNLAPVRLLARPATAVSDTVYQEVKNKARNLYPYLEVLARHEAAQWKIPIRSHMTREMMDNWLAEHRRIDPVLNPLGINAAMVENDEFETSILNGPQYTILQRRTFRDPLSDKMLDPLLKLAVTRGNMRAGMQQCLQQIDHSPMKKMSTPWRRVHFPAPRREMAESEDAGHIFNCIALKASQVSEAKKRHPFIWTKNMISYRAQMEAVAQSVRLGLDSTSQFLHGVDLYPQAGVVDRVKASQKRMDAKKENDEGQAYLLQRQLEAQALGANSRPTRVSGSSDEETEDEDEEMGGTEPAPKPGDSADPTAYPIRLPANFRGPFLYSRQKFLHETWIAQVRRLEKIYPVLLRAYQRSPRALLHACLEQIHFGKLTPYGIARQRFERTSRHIGDITPQDLVEANVVVVRKFQEYVDKIKYSRYECDFAPYDPARRSDHPLVTEDGLVPKMVSEKNIQDLLMLAEESRIPEAMKPLEPQHPLFLNFWDRLSSIMYSNHTDNPWSDVNSRVSVETIMKLVNEGPASPTASCRRFTFARSDILNYLDRLHAQHRIYYERDETIVGGWVLRPDTPEEQHTTIHPEARFVWDIDHRSEAWQDTGDEQALPTMRRNLQRHSQKVKEYPSYVEAWDATLDSFTRWHDLEKAAAKEGKGIETATGTRNFLVAPETVDYLISAAYRLGYTIRLLKQLLKKAPGVSPYIWGPEDDKREIEANEYEAKQDIPPPQAVHARLAAWEAAVVNDPQLKGKVPTLRDVVRLSDKSQFREDMTETEAQRLIANKLIEEAKNNHTMLWPARRVTYSDPKTGATKVALKRDNVWAWAHPDVMGPCSRRFFYLDKWPLEALPPSKRAKIVQDEDVDERQLFNPLEGDIPQDREHYQPIVFKKIGEGEDNKHVPGPPRYVMGDTPRQRKFIETRIAAMIDSVALETYVTAVRNQDSKAIGELAERRAAERKASAAEDEAVSGPSTAPDTPANAPSNPHRKQPSNIVRLFGATFRKPWLQDPLPPASPTVVPKSIEADQAAPMLWDMEGRRLEESRNARGSDGERAKTGLFSAMQVDRNEMVREGNKIRGIWEGTGVEEDPLEREN